MKELSNRPNSQELIDFLGIELIELPELLKQGLPAYFGELGLEVKKCDDMDDDEFNKSFNSHGGLDNYPILFSMPVGDWETRMRWLDEFKEFWFKKEEVFEFLNTQKKRPHDDQHDKHSNDHLLIKRNTKRLLQDEFKSLISIKGENFTTYNDVLNHPNIKEVMRKQGLNSRKKAKEYLSPVAKKICPLLCKRGRPKKP